MQKVRAKSSSFQRTRLDVLHIVSSGLEFSGPVPHQDCYQTVSGLESFTSLSLPQFPIEEDTDFLSKHVEMHRVNTQSIFNISRVTTSLCNM